MRLVLRRSILRPWCDDDEASLLHHANGSQVWRYMRDGFPHPYTHEHAASWLGYARSQRPLTNLAIEVDGQAVGSVGLELGVDVYRRSAEIGYWLGEDCWGRGIMTEAVAAYTEHAFRTHDLCRVFARVFAPNTASMRVLDKAGFTRESVQRMAVYKSGQMLDQVTYVVLRAHAAGAAHKGLSPP